MTWLGAIRAEFRCTWPHPGPAQTDTCEFVTHFGKPLWTPCTVHRNIVPFCSWVKVSDSRESTSTKSTVWGILERLDRDVSVPRLFVCQRMYEREPIAVVLPVWLCELLDTSTMCPLEKAAAAWMHVNGDADIVDALGAMDRLGAPGDTRSMLVHRRMMELVAGAPPALASIGTGWLRDLAPLARDRVPVDVVRLESEIENHKWRRLQENQERFVRRRLIRDGRLDVRYVDRNGKELYTAAIIHMDGRLDKD